MSEGRADVRRAEGRHRVGRRVARRAAAGLWPAAIIPAVVLSPRAACALTLAVLSAACGDRPAELRPALAAASTSDRPSSVAGDPWFEETAAESGLRFRHVAGRNGHYYFAEMMGAGVALLDFDGDEDLDVYLVQGGMLDGAPLSTAIDPPDPGAPAGDRLFRNDLEVLANGERRLAFTDVTEAAGIEARGYGMGVATGDVDGDGWVDLYVTNLGPNQLWRNRGDGSFEEVGSASGVADPRWSVPALFFDADRDGRLDLYVGNYLEWSVATDKPCLNALGGRNYCGPLSFQPQGDSLYRNRGDGTFEDWSRRAGFSTPRGGALGAVAGDFDGDGREDLYVANDGLPNQLWRNLGAGSFEDIALLAGAAVNESGQPEASMGIAAADLDGDGDEELFMTHLTGELSRLFVNDGSGMFSDRTLPLGLGEVSYEKTGFGAGFLDADNDGRLDLLVANGAVRTLEALVAAGDPFPLHQTNQLFVQRADGSFADLSEAAGGVFALSEVSRGAAFGDLDQDGDTDVVVINVDGPVRLLRNGVGQRQPWLGLRLLRRSGQGDQLGAKVDVHFAGGTLEHRVVRTAGSYASSSDSRLSIAPGLRGVVQEVRVRWPDGACEVFPPPALGRYTALRQGAGAGC